MALPQRLPNGYNFHRFCESYGITILPCEKNTRYPYRPANAIIGGDTLRRIYRKSPDLAGTLVLCIQASNNQYFDSISILAVRRVLDAHFALRKRREAVSSFKAIDIGKIRERAQRLNTGQSGRVGSVPDALAFLIADAIIEKDGAS